MIYDSDDIFILFFFDLLTYKNISLDSAHTPDVHFHNSAYVKDTVLFIPNYRQIVPTTQMHTPGWL